MGTVYLGKHLHLDSVVAIKEIRAQYTTDEERREALVQCETEARFLVKLNHPNLPKVTDAFIDNDRCYLIMEYVQGVTLEALRLEASGPMDALSVVEWALQIADVLSYLHGQIPPIIFRDLKPANVMVQPDSTVRLIDFGIARRFQPGAQKDTALFGSVGYSPPEQFGLRQTDPRADIYAFGATLHHLLTGRDPAVEPFQFPPVNQLTPGVPVSLSRLVASCVAMDPEHRPQTVHEVAVKLLSVHEELVELRQNAPPTRSTGRFRSKTRSGPLSAGLDAGRAPTGPMGNTTKKTTISLPAGSSQALVGLVAGLVVLALLIPGIMLMRGSHGPARLPAHDALPPAGKSVTPNVDADGGPIAETHVVTGSIQVPDDPQDLPDSELVHVKCEVRGLAGSEARVEVRFYDMDDNSSPPRVLLRGEQKLNVQSNDDTFDTTVHISKAGLTTSPRDGLKLQCVLLDPGGHKIAATDIRPLGNPDTGVGSGSGDTGSPQSSTGGASGQAVGGQPAGGSDQTPPAGSQQSTSGTPATDSGGSNSSGESQ
jgi:serine/threonine-protein kinase